MPVWGLPCAPCVETAFAVRIHLSHPYPIPPPSHPLLCRGREIGGRVLTVSIRCTAESSTFRRTSIVVSGSRPEAALRGVGRFIVAGRLPISGKTVGRTGGAIFLASFHIIKSTRTGNFSRTLSTSTKLPGRCANYSTSTKPTRTGRGFHKRVRAAVELRDA